MMFRMIGGAVVYGFALYGVAAFLDRPRVKVFLDQGRQGHDSHGKAPETQQEASSAGVGPSPASSD